MGSSLVALFVFARACRGCHTILMLPVIDVATIQYDYRLRMESKSDGIQEEWTTDEETSLAAQNVVAQILYYPEKHGQTSCSAHYLTHSISVKGIAQKEKEYPESRPRSGPWEFLMITYNSILALLLQAKDQSCLTALEV